MSDRTPNLTRFASRASGAVTVVLWAAAWGPVSQLVRIVETTGTEPDARTEFRLVLHTGIERPARQQTDTQTQKQTPEIFSPVSSEAQTPAAPLVKRPLPQELDPLLSGGGSGDTCAARGQGVSIIYLSCDPLVAPEFESLAASSVLLRLPNSRGPPAA